MKRAHHTLFALCLLPLLTLSPSCGGGESTDTSEDSTASAADTATAGPSGPAATSQPKNTEKAATTESGMDALEALEADAAGAATTAKQAVIPKAARDMYDTYCFTCHGKTGKGDGPAGLALNPQPASFGNKEWQESVTDEHIATVIAEGGAAAGKSPLMPPAPGVKGNEELLNGLVAIVREFGE